MAVVTTVTSKGRAQATVVSAGPYQDKMAFVSRGETLKVKHVQRTGRCTVTCLNPQTMRYATIEGRAVVHGFDNTDEAMLLKMLHDVYAAVGRNPDGMSAFDQTMRDEHRAVILI